MVEPMFCLGLPSDVDLLMRNGTMVEGAVVRHQQRLIICRQTVPKHDPVGESERINPIRQKDNESFPKDLVLRLETHITALDS